MKIFALSAGIVLALCCALISCGQGRIDSATGYVDLDDPNGGFKPVEVPIIITQPTPVKVTLWNVLGEMVGVVYDDTLPESAFLKQGRLGFYLRAIDHSWVTRVIFSFDGVEPGIYFLRIELLGQTYAHKLMIPS